MLMAAQEREQPCRIMFCRAATNYVIVTLIMVCKHHHCHLVTDTDIMMVNILIALIETICHSASGDRSSWSYISNVYIWLLTIKTTCNSIIKGPERKWMSFKVNLKRLFWFLFIIQSVCREDVGGGGMLRYFEWLLGILNLDIDTKDNRIKY